MLGDMPFRRRWFRAGLAVAGLFSACGNSDPGGADAGTPVDPWTGAEVSCDGSGVRVLRVLPWPGSGLQIALEADVGELSLEESDGGVVPSDVASVGDARGLTAILVVPAEDAAVQGQRIAAARALLEGLAEGERIAIFEAPVAPATGDEGAETSPRLVAELTRDRAHLSERLDDIAPASDRAAAPALPLLRDKMAAVETSFGALFRQIIVVGEAPEPEDGAAYQPVALAFLDEEGTSLDASRAYAGWSSGRSPESAASELLSYLEARREGASRVGACPSPGAGALVLRAGSTRCTVARPDPMSDMALAPCDAGAAARDAYPYPTEIDLSFTDEERQIYDQRYEANSKEDFRLHVRLGTGTPLPARAHFRGQTSLACERKSYFVEIDGSAPRRFLPGAASDRFLLISMCKDNAYFGQVFGDRLMARMELFPLHLGYVRLRVDRANQGVYLLLEHPDRTIVADLVEPRAVIRRRFDPDGISPEVEFPTDSALAADALSRYLALVQLAGEGDVAGLDAALAQGMAVDGYLRLLSLNTLFENGDNVDEVFFYASEEEDAWWFRVAGWDPDDLFEACHHDGIWALEDACGLLYCAEADLDHALLRSPEVYRRFGAVLAETIEALPQATLETMMQEIRAELFTLLDDETAAALVELVGEVPAAATAEGAKAEIDTRMQAMLEQAGARRQWLIDRLASCPEANP